MDLYFAFQEGEHVKIFNTTRFGFRKITVERPLKLNFQVSSERIERLKAHRTFGSLAESKYKHADISRAASGACGRLQPVGEDHLKLSRVPRSPATPPW